MAVIEGQCVRVDREPGRLIVTPHPVLLDGQRNIAAELRPGETLGAFLSRHIDLTADVWEVRIGGVLVPSAVWHLVRPKDGQVIEVRGAVHRSVLYIVAMLVLTYFTFGIGTAAGWGAGAAAGAFGGGLAGAMFATAVFAAGSILINKVLGPKPPKANNRDPDSVYSLGASRNGLRPYEPVPLLFGEVRITPDFASKPYTWYAGNDQYLGMVLNCGINVASVADLRNGDTLYSSYQAASAYYNGFASMPDDPIPLYSNADTIPGGELNKNATWIERTTPLDTVRIQLDIDYMLGDMTAKGKDLNNTETVVAEYRPTGSAAWSTLASRRLTNHNYDPKRLALIADVPRGQYDVRVRRLGQAIEIERGKASFTWATMTAVQADSADYTGLARIGLMVKATGQLNGAMDELRCLATAAPVQAWTGSGWQTAATRGQGLSNPGAQILAYARGFHDENGRIIAGIGLDDEQIDIEALQGFMLHCAAEGYTYDHYLKDARSHDDVLNAIALAGFGQVTWAGGRLSVVWAAAGQPLSGVVNMATIKKGQFQVDYTLANAADGIEFTYFDRTDWQPKTLRVAAPGVSIMLNPAQVQGEGITTEAHAARLARWHLAQSLYQYKDISYSTDLEHLSYRRLSVLALQHDLTQWGHGGRLRAVTVNAGVVTLTLDEHVPQPALDNAYIGLRVPGEVGYRVFKVQSFDAPTDTVMLTDPWPVDVGLPGDTDDNPAHDTIWIYDFKQTPGYRVRVVGIEPESDLKGASVSVVPESPEFWTYVHTGAYTPPPNQSLIPLVPPVPGGFTASPIADGVLLTWTASAAREVTYIVERAPDVDGEPGEWAPLTRTADLRYASAEPSGMGAWYRVRAVSLNQSSDWAGPLVAVPISSNPPVIDLVIVNGVITINCLYEQFALRLTADATVRFVNVPYTKTILIEIEQGALGGHVLTWPSSVVPVSGVPYVVSTTAGAVDMVGLTTNTQGVTWRLTAQKPIEGGGGAFVVMLSPSPAGATADTDGVTPAAPSVQVTALVGGGTDPVAHAWTRADANGGMDFEVDDATSDSPTFTIPADVTAYPATLQQWRDTASDATGMQAQAVVDITLERTAPDGGGPTGFTISGTNLYYGECAARTIGGSQPCTPYANVSLAVTAAVYPVTWTLTKLSGGAMTANPETGGTLTSGSIGVIFNIGSGTTNVSRQATYRVDAQDATGAQASHTFDVALERVNDL